MISIVIPFYNEAARAEPRLSQSVESLRLNVKDPFELIFVNDGSTDQTLQILESVKNSHQSLPIEIISYDHNQGKGYAVRLGVDKIQGDKIIIMDADFSIDLSEVNTFTEKLDRFDVVVGSKKHLLTRTENRQKIPRRILGKGFTWLTNILLGLNFTDITCGFKGFKTAAAKNIFVKQVMNGWSYDAETLFLAKRFKYSMLELPVKWRHVEGSKVSPVRDTLRSLRDLVLIIDNYHRGKYN